MAVIVIKFFKVVDIPHDNPDGGFLAGGAHDFPMQGFFHKAPVIEAALLVLNRLPGKGFTEFDIGDGEGEVFGQSDGHLSQVGNFGIIARVDIFKVEQAEDIALGH